MIFPLPGIWNWDSDRLAHIVANAGPDVTLLASVDCLGYCRLSWPLWGNGQWLTLIGMKKARLMKNRCREKHKWPPKKIPRERQIPAFWHKQCSDDHPYMYTSFHIYDGILWSLSTNGVYESKNIHTLSVLVYVAEWPLKNIFISFYPCL